MVRHSHIKGRLMPIAQGNKRYYLTLDQDITDNCKKVLADLGAPPDALSKHVSDCVEGFLLDLIQTVDARKRKGKKTTFEDYERLSSSADN